MERVFVDTNIILDWLGQREPYFVHAKELFKKVEDKEIIIVSTMSFITTEYILRKQPGKAKAKLALSAIGTIVSICHSGEKEINSSLASSFKDFEDAFQYFNALSNSAKIIITRNPKDFKHSKLPIMTANEYLQLFN